MRGLAHLVCGSAGRRSCNLCSHVSHTPGREAGTGLVPVERPWYAYGVRTCAAWRLGASCPAPLACVRHAGGCGTRRRLCGTRSPYAPGIRRVLRGLGTCQHMTRYGRGLLAYRVRRVHGAPRASCPAPLVRTARRKLVRVSKEAPGRIRVSISCGWSHSVFMCSFCQVRH